MKKHLVERLMAQANREANELAELLEEAATEIDELNVELDAWEKNCNEQIDLLNKIANERDALKADAIIRQSTERPTWNT